MKENIVIAVVGNRNSGKTRTWNTLFGQTVRTGNRVRQLFLTPSEYVDVFLVSGSPEERHIYVGDIIGEHAPRIVLCSMQYREDVTQSIDYFLQHEYSIYMHWLNPGYSDTARQPDSLALMSYLLDRQAVIAVRDGQSDPTPRVQELSDFVFGWARRRNLLRVSSAVQQTVSAILVPVM